MDDPIPDPDPGNVIVLVALSLTQLVGPVVQQLLAAFHVPVLFVGGDVLVS